MLDWAYFYYGLGFSVIPQIPGEKKPPIRWKEFQDRRPTVEELSYFFCEFPDAGLAVVLGPVSNLFVVDVDGADAYEALLKYLGELPRAPTVMSGSGEPFRFHLFLRHPPIDTKAKSTPWHEKLEFRGKGGLVVLPPSLHKSANRYRWAEGLSLEDVPLPDTPAAVIEALQAATHPRQADEDMAAVRIVESPNIYGISLNTQHFLRGLYANGPRWNDRLFWAACDLCGNGIPLERALPLLLAGAQPWTRTEEENARRTIQSAYSEQRLPGRQWRRDETQDGQPEAPVQAWNIGGITVRQMRHAARHLPGPGTFRIES